MSDTDTPDLRVTHTPNFNLNLPDVAGDWDLWGELLNANWTFMDGALLPIWGGQMTGLLGLSGDPTTPLGAATRRYVDAVAANQGNYLPLAGGTMTGPLQVPQGSAAAPSVQLGGVNNGIYAPANGNVGISAAGTSVFSTSSITARFNIPLQLQADPTANLGAATKQYVDAVTVRLGNYLPLDGSAQMTGPLITAAGAGGSNLGIGIGNNTTGLWTSGGNALVLQTGGATNLYLSPTGNTIGQSTTMATGTTFTLAADATQPMQAVTLQQMGAIVGGPYLPIAGGTLTGPLLLNANPTANLGAATKQYVDALGNTAAATYLPLAGGALTGPLALAADPTTAPQAATKRYVDARPATTTPRNLFHNPGTYFAQRGVGPFTGNVNTLDRWLMGFSGSDTSSVTRQALSDADRAAIADERASYCLQNVFTGSSNAASGNYISQHIEDVRSLAGKVVTVSFWARCLAGTMTLPVNGSQIFGSGGSPSAPVGLTTQTVTISSVWARYALQFNVPSVAGKILGTNQDDCTAFNIYGSAQGLQVQSGTLQLWGLQCEVGAAASPLELPSRAIDLENCQRFCYAFIGPLNCGGIASGVSQNAYHQLFFPAQMRAAPTSSGITWGGNSNLSAYGLAGLLVGSAIVYGTSAAPGTFLAQLTGAIFSADL